LKGKTLERAVFCNANRITITFKGTGRKELLYY